MLLAAALSLLVITPISTDLSYGHFVWMGVTLIAAVLIPYLISTKVFKENILRFPLRHGRKWYRREIAYIFFAGTAAYLLLPFYLYQTGSYLNWDVHMDASHIIRLFIGTNALGIWDELFFVGVCLALLKQHMPFWWANSIQAALWTLFLYELGFRGWGPFVVFGFALSQGYIFRKSKSFLYILTIHLTIDFILFLALIHLHYPQYLDIFITSPF